MTEAVCVPVNMAELRDAFEFVSAGPDFEHCAYVCLDTGRVYCRSTLDDEAAAELPEDLETSERYLCVPGKTALDLGRRLALRFTAQELPADYETVVSFFRRCGAYGRFKDLLHRRAALQRWYAFEDQAVTEALLAWCAEVGLAPAQA